MLFDFAGIRGIFDNENARRVRIRPVDKRQRGGLLDLPKPFKRFGNMQNQQNIVLARNRRARNHVRGGADMRGKRLHDEFLLINNGVNHQPDAVSLRAGD